MKSFYRFVIGTAAAATLAATALPAAARVDVQVGVYVPGAVVGYYAPPPPPRVIVVDDYYYRPYYRPYPPPHRHYYAPPPPPPPGWRPHRHDYYERERHDGWRR